MNREHKFRLLDRKGRIVGYERWDRLAGQWCYARKSDGPFIPHEPFIPHVDKDEYVGHKVKNGKDIEIYEGDKIRLDNNRPLCEIRWQEESARWILYWDDEENGPSYIVPTSAGGKLIDHIQEEAQCPD